MNLLAKYSFSPQQMIEVLDHCKQVDIDAFCTPWDLPSLRVLADYGVPALKIASADMTNHQLLRACAAATSLWRSAICALAAAMACMAS